MYIAFQYLLLLTFFYDSLKLLSVLVRIHFTDQTNELSFLSGMYSVPQQM